MSDNDVESLSNIALEFEFCKATGQEVFGSPEGPFVVRVDDDAIALFMTDERPVHYRSFLDNDTLYPLRIASKLDASFVATNGIVRCQIGRTVASGNSYSEAAMRAVVAYVDAGGVIP